MNHSAHWYIKKYIKIGESTFCSIIKSVENLKNMPKYQIVNETIYDDLRCLKKYFCVDEQNVCK